MTPTFHSLAIGDELTTRVTVTESHLLMASAIFADFAPLHVDDLYAAQTRYGARVAHGPLILGIMAGVLGTKIGVNAAGLLELDSRFKAPVLIGQTVTARWVVSEKTEKPKLGGGIVRLGGTASVDDGTVAVEAMATMVVAYGE